MKTSARTWAHACHSRRGRSDCAHSSLGAPDGQAGKGANLVAIEDGPDAVNWTHADQVNAELANFLREGAVEGAASSPEM